jgi:hypothetical protein
MKKIYYLIILSLLFSSSLVIGRGFRVTQIPNGSKFSCNTCHTNGGGTPRNEFGLAVEDIIGISSIEFWNQDFAAQDADGDGFSNGVELQDPNGEWTFGSADPGQLEAVSHPGDNDDIPEVTNVSKLSKNINNYFLGNNFPNPFNPSTTISFNLINGSKIILEIYNSLGQKVITLADRYYSKGNSTVIWNAEDNYGNKVESGIYFYRLVANGYIETKSMVLLK